ncbi:BCCT family transporter [Bacillus sp. FJAT-45350]|uniref:BCCT family transporter n=1 Tax=Bacillus sp. FJAT-45350 TaxID=2011014 RepID=UPI000BB868FD|nr:BCCT family transporter [Bacillus sp. FJAT-45350]
MEQNKIDKLIFWGALVLISIVTIPVLINAEKGSQLLASVLGFLNTNFTFFYLLATFTVFVIVMYLALSKYGKIKFGNEKPEFSTFSWLAMIFTSTAGSSLVYWGFVEWAYYYTAPPFGIEPMSVQAAEWASTYGIFHWGFMGFAIYCFPAIVLAYAVHVKKIPSLRLSNACRGVLGDKVDGPIGKMIDMLFMFGIIGGVSTSLGLGTPMLSQAISELLGISHSIALDTGIIILWTLIFSASLYFGLNKGLKVLSNINVYLYIFFIIFFIVVGPTLFILNKFVDSMGLLLQNFIQMSLYTDSVGGSSFAQDWTVFYWGWWFAFAAYMAMFTARVSKGRTLRGVVFGMLGGGTLGCALAFMVFGNTSMYFELNGIVPVLDIFASDGAPAAIIATIAGLPFAGEFLLAIFIIFCFIFLATTIDSAAYTLSFMSAKPTKVIQEPARWIRLFWAFVLGGVAITLMYGGGLSALQTLAVITGFPIIFIFGIIGKSFFNWLKEDFKNIDEHGSQPNSQENTLNPNNKIAK